MADRPPNPDEILQVNQGQGPAYQANHSQGPLIQGENNQVTINNYGAMQPPESLKPGAPFRVSGGGSGVFVGRGEELERLRGLLGQPGVVAIAAAAGLGGVGKTALAREYVRRYRGEYPAGVWWLAPGDRAGSLVTEAEILGWGEPPESLQTESQRVQWVYQRWLERFPAGDRLLIWDDGEQFGEIRPFLPTDPRFQVLLTTRSKWGQPVRRLDLDSLPRADAFRLLRRLMADDGRLRREVPEAKALCAWLGDLPLGVELVGRYLAVRPGVSLAKTLERLEAKRLEARALNQLPEEMEYQYSVQAAFELSWQTLAQPERELLGALSLFGLAPIPLGLIESALSGWDEEDLEEGLAGLVQRSLVSVQAGQQTIPEEGGRGGTAPTEGRGVNGVEPQVTYGLHALVREFGRGKLGTELGEQGDALRRGVAHALVEIAKNIPHTILLKDMMYLKDKEPHLVELSQSLTNFLEEDEVIIPMTKMAWIAENQGRWLEAEQWKKNCVDLARNRLGDKHPNTAQSINNLGNFYERRGLYTKAEPFLLEALAIWSELQHPDMAQSIHSLGNLNVGMSNYKKAESFFNQALSIWKEILEPNHPYIAQCLSSLGNIYYRLKMFEEAEKLAKETLQYRKSYFGTKAPQIAMSMNNLGEIYREMQRYDAAEAMFKQAISMLEETKGGDDSDIGIVLNNLASLYFFTKRFSEAEDLMNRAFKILKTCWGDKHPDTQLVSQNLALIKHFTHMR